MFGKHHGRKRGHHYAFGHRHLVPQARRHAAPDPAELARIRAMAHPTNVRLGPSESLRPAAVDAMLASRLGENHLLRHDPMRHHTGEHLRWFASPGISAVHFGVLGFGDRAQGG